MIKEILKDLLEALLKYIKSNIGKTIGTFIGIIFGIMILSLGFFKTIFIILCASLGSVLGEKIDEGENLKDILLKVFHK